jgi:hypothetical protein
MTATESFVRKLAVSTPLILFSALSTDWAQEMQSNPPMVSSFVAEFRRAHLIGEV